MPREIAQVSPVPSYVAISISSSLPGKRHIVTPDRHPSRSQHTHHQYPTSNLPTLLFPPTPVRKRIQPKSRGSQVYPGYSDDFSRVGNKLAVYGEVDVDEGHSEESR
jgi:hypothetical protein